MVILDFPARLGALLTALLFAFCASTSLAQESDDGLVTLQFPNNPISDVLGIYELLTDTPLVKDVDIFDLDSISLITAKPVTKDAAIALIESSLYNNGYVLVADAESESIHVYPSDSAPARLTENLTIYRTPAELPRRRFLVNYFMALEHMDPTEAGSLFQNHAGLNRYGKITAIENPRGLLIKENTAIIRKLISLKDVIDVPPSRARDNTFFIELEYADASVVARIVQASLNERPRPTSPAGLTFEYRGDEGIERAAARAKAQIVADDRLNRITVIGSKQDFEYVENLVKRFDQPIKTEAPYERALNYVYVDEVLPVLVDILQDSGTGTSPLPGGGSITTRRQPQASSQAGTLTGRQRTGVQVRENANPDSAGGQDMLTSPLNNTAPLSVLVGKTRLIADLQANALIVMGPKTDVAKIDKLLDRLDRKPPQVYLATVIGQLTLGDGIDYGFNYLRQFQQKHDGGIAAGLTLDDAVRNSANDVLSMKPNALIPSATGFNVYGQIRDQLDIFINALESTEKFEVLSRPVVTASNNKKATITSGRQIPIPTSSLTDVDEGSTAVRTSIDFRDVVLKLEVIPLINADGEVSLTIAQVNDTVVGQAQVAENTVPIIGTEKLTTTVTVPDRTTVVIGGLISESEERVTDGVPFVSRVPVLGHAFKKTRKQKTRKELIMFIQPIVVRDESDELLAASQAEDLRTQTGAELYETFPDNESRQLPPPPPLIRKAEEEEKLTGRRTSGPRDKRSFIESIFGRK